MHSPNRFQSPRPRISNPVLVLLIAAIAAVAAIAQCGFLLDSAAAGRTSGAPALLSTSFDAGPSAKQRVAAASADAEAGDKLHPN